MSLVGRGKKRSRLEFFFHPSSFFDDDGRHFRVLRLFGNTLATLLDLSVKKIFFFGFYSSTFSISKVVKRNSLKKKQSKLRLLFVLFMIFSSKRNDKIEALIAQKPFTLKCKFWLSIIISMNFMSKRVGFLTKC